MNDLNAFEKSGIPGGPDKDVRGTVDQIILAAVLGVAAFLGFCILRPRWSSLYAARKKSKDGTYLPELPDSFLGWIVPLFKITDQQVLASAGLDAYVFLRFFRMAATYLAIILFFALAVIKPVHDVYDPAKEGEGGGNDTSIFTGAQRYNTRRSIQIDMSNPFGIRNSTSGNSTTPDDDYYWIIETDYLWMYLVFAYIFSILLMYMIVSNTRQVIEVRQEYLGTQTTITDKTIRLSGIPAELQSEEKIKQFMEELDIGKVESVTLCKDWSELDQLMQTRQSWLRKLEAALVTHHGNQKQESSRGRLPASHTEFNGAGTANNEDDEDEQSGLMPGNGQAHVSTYDAARPTTTIRYGRLWLQSKQVDAIDYYEEKLRKVDEKIQELRKNDFTTTPMAFVTMDSVAASQMASQAVLDPSPLQLLANLSPAPADVIWENTYLSRRHRMWRAWSITALIVILTVFWSILLVPIAGALNTSAIRKVFPPLAAWLDSHKAVRSLVENQLPTIVVSLLNVAVPYLYEWLASCQGMTSQGDVELSVISKNFFFTFVNFFLVFSVLGTVSNAFSLFEDIEKRLRNTTILLHGLAKSLNDLIGFYTNFLILQALGLLPFKLLQMGSLSLYPIYRIGAKTPRDYAELAQPGTFSYGMFLPQTLLIFDICLVYSILRDSWKVLLCGFAYFVIGSFIYKYQLLYAMAHRQHSTGRSWIMMCDRVLVGLVVFQLTVSGQLLLKNIDTRGTLVLPLVIATIWFSYAFNKTYRPLMTFIALRSVRRAEHMEFPAFTDDDLPEDMARWREASDNNQSRATSNSREEKMTYVNPSLIAPLEGPWTSDKDRQSRSVGNALENTDLMA
ncbi:Calcium permeable stress-gated cation channel 1 [Elsinoe australis]|uniref:Calcium permeable stress-gated cation channel 1 n=1 Tax=Elsinoe australis TaxID=40998 RepID=A0A2P7Z650_9PEZI|nr:Calcium permeable stress-gated cation channel 1 [Elsinoe australis]